MGERFTDNHTRVTDPAEISVLLERLNAELHSAGLYFKVDVRDDLGYNTYPDDQIPANALAVIGSFDFAYYHQLELFFYGVRLHNLPDDDIWPDHWDKPQLELLTDVQRDEALNVLQITVPSTMCVFAFNRGSHGDDRYFLAAEGLSVFTGTVFYYNRSAQEPLKENERNGWWIR